MQNQFGKVSKLNLEASFRDGKTILGDISFTAPFKVMRPFYEKKDRMSVMLLTASAGILSGDCQEIRICVKEHAHMELLSQAYEKIHRMEEGFASRKVFICVEDHASLHYMPLPVIPFRDADYRSEMEVELKGPTSGFALLDVLSCGRAAHGEAFQYRRLENRVTIRQEGRMIYRDLTRYEPEWMDIQGFGLYEGYTHLGNLVICNGHKTEDWVKRVRSRIDDAEGMEGGVTETAHGDVAVRILGRNAEKMTALLQNILADEKL